MKDRSRQPPSPNSSGLGRSSGPFNSTGLGQGGAGIGDFQANQGSGVPMTGATPSNPMLSAYAQSGGDPNATVGSTTGAGTPGFDYRSSTTPQVRTASAGPDAIPGSSPVSGNGAPGNPLTPTANGFGPVQNTINTSNVPGMVGGNDLAGSMKTAQDAAYTNARGYLDPQWDQQQQAMETKLTNQGIPQNSEAWNKAMDEHGRQKEFAYSQARSGAVQQGNAAQNQMFAQGLASNQNQFGQNSAQAQFYNQAQQQMAAQGLSQQQITNNLRVQLEQQGLTRQQIDNLEQQNRFQNSMTMRNQDINELLLQQQNPLNMLNSLNNGSQVQQPQFTSSPGNNMSAADLMSAFQNQYSGQLNSYNAQTGASNSQNSAIAQIIAAYLCDRRLKTNIRMIGMHTVGVPLYEFDYLWGEHGVGVMADELEVVLPEAVHSLPNGFKFVDYARL